MSLDWLPREHELKNHLLFEEDMVKGKYWGTDDDAPCVVYTKKPLVNPGKRRDSAGSLRG